MSCKPEYHYRKINAHRFFYYSEHSDILKCVDCGIEINKRAVDYPVVIHGTYFDKAIVYSNGNKNLSIINKLQDIIDALKQNEK